VHLYCALLEAGKPSAGFVFTVQDITPLKQADRSFKQRIRAVHTGFVVLVILLCCLLLFLRKNLKAITHSEQELKIFKDALDNATDAIGMATPDGRHYYQNKAFDALFGSICEFPPDTLYVDPEVGRKVFKVILAGGQWAGEVKMYGRDRSILDIFLRAYANKDKNGQIVSVLGVHTNITERNQTAIALSESESKLATLFSSMSEMVVINELVFDEQGRPVNYRMIDCNKAFIDITGIARETAVGRLATEIYGTDTPPYLEEFSRVALTGQPYRFETYFPPMEKHFSVSVVRPANNQFATITADITTRWQSEQEHSRLQAQLTQAQKIESIGRLAGGVAHDFNNILSVILGYTDMALQDVAPEEPLHADLLEIRNAVNRSSKLTRQLLAFARRQTMAPRVLDLNETVEEMLKMLRRLIGEDIDLIWLPGKHLHSVLMDPSQLDQILANLCVNARDAIANVGKVTIKTANVCLDEAYCVQHPGCSPGDYVLLSVGDDGCGMDRDTLANIFDPFFTTKDIGTGTGLGLSTVYGIVKQNKAYIDVTSEPGLGTCFMIYLPKHTDTADPVADTAKQEKSLVLGTETILLAEDEPANLEMYRKMLTGLGYTVLAAATPQEAIRLARDHAGTITLLLTDVVMPGMSGPDLAKIIRSDDRAVACLFMSGYTDTNIIAGGVLEPGIHLIQKPFSLEILAARIRKVIDGASET
jgi:signal transduction histidine kinase/CheY-like chemotaxis protein